MKSQKKRIREMYIKAVSQSRRDKELGIKRYDSAMPGLEETAPQYGDENSKIHPSNKRNK